MIYKILTTLVIAIEGYPHPLDTMPEIVVAPHPALVPVATAASRGHWPVVDDWIFE